MDKLTEFVTNSFVDKELVAPSSHLIGSSRCSPKAESSSPNQHQQLELEKDRRRRSSSRSPGLDRPFTSTHNILNINNNNDGDGVEGRKKAKGKCRSFVLIPTIVLYQLIYLHALKIQSKTKYIYDCSSFLTNCVL